MPGGTTSSRARPAIARSIRPLTSKTHHGAAGAVAVAVVYGRCRLIAAATVSVVPGASLDTAAAESAMNLPTSVRLTPAVALRASTPATTPTSSAAPAEPPAAPTGSRSGQGDRRHRRPRGREESLGRRGSAGSALPGGDQPIGAGRRAGSTGRARDLQDGRERRQAFAVLERQRDAAGERTIMDPGCQPQ